MNRAEVFDLLDGSTDEYDYGKHELLINMTCVFESDVDETEVTFAVPSDFVLETIKQYPSWSWSDLHKWLENEYTSQESQQILEEAILHHKLAFWKVA